MVVKVFLTVIADPGRVNEIYIKIKSFDEVTFAWMVDRGPHDVVAQVEVDSFDGYRVLIEKVASLPHTKDFSSFITVDV